MKKPRKFRPRTRTRAVLPAKSALKLLAIPFIFGLSLLIINQFLFVNVRVTQSENGSQKEGETGLPVPPKKQKPYKLHLLDAFDSENLDILQQPMYDQEDDFWTVNDFFDRVFVMNLDRRHEKWYSTKFRLAQFGISAERVSARDGRNEDMQKGYQAYLGNNPESDFERQIGRRRFNSAGAWAQQFSARDIITLAKLRGYGNFLMLEDDVLLHKNFSQEFNRHIKTIPAKWKAIYLGATQHTWGSPGALRYDEGQDLYYHPYRTDGVFAIAFDESVYDLLLSEIDKHSGPFDSYPARHVIQTFPQDSYVFLPNLMVADVGSSDTQEGRNQTEMAKKLRWDMSVYNSSPVEEEYKRIPKVSVIITSYNAAETIFLSLRSIQQQTYRNLEIIVVDDHSTDDTASYVTSLARKDDRIILIENEVNHGTYASRNIALKHATGEIITFQDADDIALPKRIEVQAAPINDGRSLFTVAHVIRSHVPKAKFEEFFHGYVINYEDMAKEVQKARTHRKGNGQYEYCCKEILGLMTTMFHRSVFRAIGPFEEPRFSGDSEFAERLLAHYTGTIMKGKESVHAYLWKQPAIMHVYQRIDDVVLYSIDKNNTLSKTVPIWGEEREKYRKEYQRRIRDRVERRNPQYFWYPPEALTKKLDGS